MTSIHALVVRYASPFALHVIVSSIVLAIAIAASYLPRLSARTRFAILAAGMAKFLLPAALVAPFISRSAAVTVMQLAMPRALPVAALQPRAAAAVTPLDWIVVFAAVVCLLFVAAMIIAGVRAVAAATSTALPAAAR